MMKKRLLALLLCVCMVLPMTAYGAVPGAFAGKFSAAAVQDLVDDATDDAVDEPVEEEAPAVEAPVVEETPVVEEPAVEEPAEDAAPEAILDGSDKVKVDDGNTVSVEGIPTNAELSIGEPTKKSLRAITKAAKAEDIDTSNALFAYDISIVDENGDEWQPDGSTVTVELKIPDLDLQENEFVKIMHNHGGEVEIILLGERWCLVQTDDVQGYCYTHLLSVME